MVDGKEQLVTATTSTRDLAKNLDAARSSAIRFRDSILTINQMGQAFQGLMSGLSAISSAMTTYTQAFAVQEQNEQRLATVMRQRMGASAQDIEQMKELARTQQQLGIIGDEVQLAGMQQVATFLKQKDSLAVLTPALNNLLAQQKGYSATAQDAQAVGNLMGKAMQGQASALRRVGITFDEAQEKVLKFGTESEKAAMLAEIITQNVGDMNSQLRQTSSGHMKALSNEMSDLSEKIGKVMMPFQGLMSQITQMGFLLMGLGQIFTSVKAVMMVMGTTVKSLAISSGLFSKQAYIQSAATLMLGGASKSTALALAGLKMAIRGLLISTGVGAVIAGLTYAIELLMNSADKTTDKLEDMSDATNEVSQAYVQAKSTIELNIAKLKDLIDAKKQGQNVSKKEKETVAQLNNTYGETMGYFASVEAWYKALIANSKAYCDQMIIEAQTRRLANQIAEKREKQRQITHNDDGTKRTYGTKRETKTVATGQVDAGDGKVLPVYETKEVPGTSPIEKAQKEYDDLGKSIAADEKQMQSLVEQSGKIKMPVTGAPTAPAPAATPTKGGKGGGSDKKDDTKKEQLALIEEAKTYKDLENNVRYYQEQLDQADITDRATIETLAKKKKAVEDQIKAFNDLQDAATADHSIEQLNDAEITTRKQLNAKLEYYNKLLDEGDEKQRTTAQKAINNLNKMGAAWDEQLAKLDAPGALDTLNDIKDIDAAIQFYSEQQQREDADNIYKTQGTINALTEKKRVLQLSIDLPDMQREVATIEKLTGRDRRVKIRAMGFDEIMEKVRELNELMEMPGVTDFQKRQLQELVGIYKSWSKQVVKSFDTVKESWSSIKGIGDGVTSITEALDGNKNAWQTITGVIDGFIQLYEGVMSIVKIIQMMTAVTRIQTAATITGTAATATATAAETTDAATQEVAALAKLPLIAANKAATASYMELASAAYFAAHAYIPFAGFGIAAGFVAAATAMTEAIGAMPFAKGGIVSGPTFAMVGEYPGASNNPEVIAPLDKLRSMLTPAYGGIAGGVRFEIEGRKLVGVLANETRVSSKSGRRTNIKV